MALMTCINNPECGENSRPLSDESRSETSAALSSVKGHPHRPLGDAFICQMKVAPTPRRYFHLSNESRIDPSLLLSLIKGRKNFQFN